MAWGMWYLERMNTYFDGAPATPLEIARGNLAAALAMGDAAEVRRILAKEPAAVHLGMRKIPLDVAIEPHYYGLQRQARLDCILALVEHGAKLCPEHSFGRRGPVHELLQNGDLETVRALHEANLLAPALSPETHGALLATLFTPKNWERRSGVAYPLAELLDVLLDAGAQATNETAYPSLFHFAIQSGSMGHLPKPPSFDAACKRLFEVSFKLKVDPPLLWTAWLQGAKETFQVLAQTYAACPDDSAMAQHLSAQKPGKAEEFQAEMLGAQTPFSPARSGTGPRL